MRLLFICGCLEPGKDGVGDYVRQLAITMVKKGMDVSAISLFDSYQNAVSEESQSFEKGSFTVLRIPQTFQFWKRIELAKSTIDKFNPDWLSLQYVPYSFHPKGLPINLVFILKRIGANRNWHIMFHELWIGMEKNSAKSQYIIGQLQRLLVRALIYIIRPLIIHTQTKLYLEQLHRIGSKAHYLQLFSNIPNVFSDKEILVEKEKHRSKQVRLVVFGNIHHSAPIEQFADDVVSYSKITKIQVNLAIVGRCGEQQEHWKDVWNSRGLKLELLGEQSAENISKIFSTATAGITTTPLILVEKSGTVAAMRSHALPVICVSRTWQPRKISNIASSPTVIEYQPGNFMSCIKEFKRNSLDYSSVEKVTDKFLNNLSEKMHHGKLQLSLD